MHMYILFVVDLQSESVAKPTMYKEKVALYKEKVAQQLSGNELSLSPSSSTTLQRKYTVNTLRFYVYPCMCLSRKWAWSLS